MKILIAILQIQFLLSIASSDFSHLNLVKRCEFNLYRPKTVGPPVLKGLQIRPLFARIPSGEIFWIEVGGAQKLWMGYFFSSDGELKRTLPIPTGSAERISRPGSITVPYTLYRDAKSRFGCYDISKRLNIFDRNGNYASSLLMPLSLSSSSISDVVYDHNTLAIASRNIQTNYPVVSIVELNETDVQLKSYQLCEKLYSKAEKKGPFAGTFIDPLVNIISTGEVVFNLSISPDIHLLTKDGILLVERTIPDHFRSFLDAVDFDKVWFKYDSSGCISGEAEEWFKTWTHSYPVYELSNNRLVVPRVLYPTFNLDLYSYSDKEIKYLGYASADKEFLFADTSGIYLLESKDDTSIVVGKYEIVTPNFREERELGWSTKMLTAEQLKGIHKVVPDTSNSDTCKPCDREKLKPKGYCNTIDSVRLISSDSIEYSLKDMLTRDKDHIIVFSSPQECALYNVFNAARDYVNDKPGFDLTLVFSHPFPEELGIVAKLAQIDWDYPILTNIDYKRIEPILKSPACFLVVSKDGTITASADSPADYPDFVPKPR